MQKKDQPENAKTKALAGDSQAADNSHLTSNQGVVVADNHNSLKAGVRGPTLLEDFLFREKMTHFDHERIPERIVHARGSAAHGTFQVYESLAEYTTAAFLQDPSVETPVFTRFSTVAGFRGSADTVRDVRGFAVKFYTEEGNFDLVGNNMPVFFIQDAIKFPDLIHAVKPEPNNEIPQAASAHDNFWDFISLMPEAMHMVMWVMSDRAFPRSYRMMEGFGIHTFRMINSAGVSRFVKFHWKPVLGVHSLVWDETQTIAGQDPDFNRRDLWEAIEMGQPAEFELGLQIIEEDQVDQFDFDILDPTKLIPEELVPVKIVGKMTLNRNPDNFFAETEQVAFHPGHVVPGIDFSNDPLLQGRLFSYNDTQLTRLGGPNFAEIPINRPIAPMHNNQRGGFMRQTINKGRVNYEPSSLGGCPVHTPEGMQSFMSYAEHIDAPKVRERSDSFTDYFTQASLFWKSQSEVEQIHIVEALQFELGKVEHKHIRERMVNLLMNVNEDLAAKVAEEIGVSNYSTDLSYLADYPTPAPSDKRGVAEPGDAPSLSMERNRKQTVATRKVAILALEGVDGTIIETLKSALEKQGAMADVISKHLGSIKTAAGNELKVDKTISTVSSVFYDAVFIPGGAKHSTKLQTMGVALHFVNQAFKHCKPIAASGEGVDFLQASAISGVDVAAKAADMLSDKGVVTSQKLDKPEAFVDAFMTAIGQHRHWDRDQKDAIPA